MWFELCIGCDLDGMEDMHKKQVGGGRLGIVWISGGANFLGAWLMKAMDPTITYETHADRSNNPTQSEMEAYARLRGLL